MEEEAATLPATAVVLPLLALISVVLDLPPFIWHVRNRNIAAANLVLWFLLNNLIHFFNAVIWPTDDVNSWFHGKILCDIEVKLIPASYIGVVGSLIGIMRNLARILDTDNTILAPSKAQKQRQQLIDWFLCVVFPSFFMILHYIVQPARFWVITVVGCQAPYDLSWLSVVLIFMWPPLLSLVVVYYCGLLIHRMRKYRRDFSSVLSSSGSNLTKNRFMRLFVMSVILIVVLIPSQAYLLLDFVRDVSYSYSWNEVHGPHWGDILLMPTHGVVGPDHWIQIAAGFMIFACFGLGRDAQEMYRLSLLHIGLGRFFPSLRMSTGVRHLANHSAGSHSTSSSGSRVQLIRGRFRKPSMCSMYKKKATSSNSVSSQSPTLEKRPTGQLSPTSETTRFSSSTATCPSTAAFPTTVAAQHVMEPLPVHDAPSRFHNFFRHAAAAAPHRQMAAGLRGFGVSTLPQAPLTNRWDHFSGKPEGFGMPV